MKPRPVPLFSRRGGPPSLDLYLVYGLMHYPDDVLSAMDFSSAAHRWNQSPVVAPSRTLELFERDMDARHGRASLCGLILVEFAALRRELGDRASIRKAIHLAARLAQEQPSGNRKRADFPSDESDIAKHFREFRSVSHLWAAFMAAGSDLSAIQGDPAKLDDFLFAAAHFASEFGFMKTKGSATAAAFFWELPLPRTSGSLEVAPSDDLQSYLKDYAPIEVRGDDGGE